MAESADKLAPTQRAERLQQAGDRLLAAKTVPEEWTSLGFNVWYPASKKSHIYQIVSFGTRGKTHFYCAVRTSEPREQDLSLALDHLFAQSRGPSDA